ncbi:class I SAM-dependent methyltransferase [Lysinibacter cavernae]|uniref:Class I SAM-dependent methyltransferase n=1 Tax=Lysinibacter cavernae TaxID=1640652 RepID=A0A7X5R473_9MICO|nr:class I SAM-dependent methyltransferase [Lysinibacter cavernae]NIH55052.1 hypothetical protein [Lysinibacter cavernae]
MAFGVVTRGTTGTNRLRRVDRWIAQLPEFTKALDPLVVDLGYGASAVTVLELERRLHAVRKDAELIGIEIEPDRVAGAREHLAKVRAGHTQFRENARVSFERGGFETPLRDGRRPAVIRAFNVLRQYQETDVAAAWDMMLARLQYGGVLIEGTCDEIGRVSSWITLDRHGPRTLTLSLRAGCYDSPSVLAERLPKALIHRNVPGEGIHRLLNDLDRAWQRNAPLASFGAPQRWLASVAALQHEGWAVVGDQSRWRLGELTVPWDTVRPLA